ncbi:hypothetical protein J6590_016606 [Homalodisca vitripennis]|nr:hypothetical protein J6590_016606 [Homalodisca vitripennis]
MVPYALVGREDCTNLEASRSIEPSLSRLERRAASYGQRTTSPPSHAWGLHSLGPGRFFALRGTFVPLMQGQQWVRQGLPFARPFPQHSRRGDAPDVPAHSVIRTTIPDALCGSIDGRTKGVTSEGVQGWVLISLSADEISESVARDVPFHFRFAASDRRETTVPTQEEESHGTTGVKAMKSSSEVNEWPHSSYSPTWPLIG